MKGKHKDTKTTEIQNDQKNYVTGLFVVPFCLSQSGTQCSLAVFSHSSPSPYCMFIPPAPIPPLSCGMAAIHSVEISNMGMHSFHC